MNSSSRTNAVGNSALHCIRDGQMKGVFRLLNPLCSSLHLAAVLDAHQQGLDGYLLTTAAAAGAAEACNYSNSNQGPGSSICLC
jgi:hypothetical protein